MTPFNQYKLDSAGRFFMKRLVILIILAMSLTLHICLFNYQP